KGEPLGAEAKKGGRYIIRNQSSDGSWKYAATHNADWIDNYHTGYVLDCLSEYIKHTGDNTWKTNLQKGFEYYLNNFFEEGFKPKFYNSSLFPVDCTAAGQSLLTLCRFGEIEVAKRVAEYTIQEMQSPEGYFYFRKYKYYTEKHSFMRWSNSWMFVGLSELLKT
ncbi:MAG TPA: pectate lyase, partial [Bacteroidia bacterium]|nr:pectate lyase [Bacteroidia bacterium]